MNTPELKHRGWFKNHLVTSCLALAFAIPGVSQAQSLINSSTFFQPAFKAKQVKPENILSLGLFDQTPYTASPSTPTGNVAWQHTLTGHTQLGVNLFVTSADAQLAAFAQTTGSTLVFGREVETTNHGLGGTALGNLVNNVVGLSLSNTWSSRARITGLNLTAGQLYTVNFDVTRAAGLNLNALSYANFTLLNNGVAIQNIESSTLLNILNIINAGTGARPAEFQFYAPAGITSLDLVFSAATVADVTLLSNGLGSSNAANQNVMTFSNISFAPVPEVSSLVLASLGVLIILRRRRPCQI
jgi:hypothetical protein